jgi:cytoplasmic iron level regulating protein YaaA (DUF328/UPF0246 family)
MSSFIAILSPAKLIDDQTHYPNLNCTQPAFLSESEQLANKLKKFSPSKLAELMDMSDALAAETHTRFQQWELPFTHQNAHPAMLMFKGEVYRGLQAQEFNPKQLAFAQKHLRILSGLYGIMRPLDLVMPYRLMMGTPFGFDKKAPNLYAFWKQKITEALDKELGQKDVLINLASQEYFKAVDIQTLGRRVIECEFKEKKGNAFVTVNTYSKLARGKMARFIIDNMLTNPSDIQAFDLDGYAFKRTISSENRFIFGR